MCWYSKQGYGDEAEDAVESFNGFRFDQLIDTQVAYTFWI